MRISTYEATKILALLQSLQKIHTEFPIQYAICLIEIYRDEGLSLTQLAQKTNIPLSTASRIIGALSDHRKNGKAFGLVTVRIAANQRRRKELYLSPSGHRIIHELTNILATKCEQRLHA